MTARFLYGTGLAITTAAFVNPGADTLLAFIGGALLGLGSYLWEKENRS